MGGIVMMTLSFLLVVSDKKAGGAKMLLWGTSFAICSAAYRGCFLEKAMHVVEGNGNILHNNQNLVGIVILPLFALATGEMSALNAVPTKMDAMWTFQYWGTLITAGFLPFIKNIIANRLIRRTGQAPWRFSEIVSIVL